MRTVRHKTRNKVVERHMVRLLYPEFPYFFEHDLIFHLNLLCSFFFYKFTIFFILNFANQLDFDFLFQIILVFGILT